MKYKTIIFDFDGVLFESEEIHQQACNYVLSNFGIALSEEEYLANYIGLSDAEMFPLIFKNKSIAIQKNDIEKILSDKINAYKNIIKKENNLTGVRGVMSFIEKHAHQFRNIGICTCATREEVAATLAKLEKGSLQTYFHTIITINDVKKGKPSPEGYLLTAKKLEASPGDCLVIEDTPKGIQAAKDAGMTVIGITTSYKKPALSNADFVVDDYQEIDFLLT